MGKLTLPLILYFIGELSLLVLSSVIQSPQEMENWFQAQKTEELKVTKLHFYFHDLREHTSIQVASANSTATSPTLFGYSAIMDDPLTEGPEFTSKPVGRVQGLYASASFSEFSLLCAMTLVFTNDKYNGSTLSVLGSNPTMHQHREMPVVGGTGVFRLARGIAMLTYIYFDVPGGNATVEYNVIVQHY